MNGAGWARCGLGHAHWGRYSAAGLLAYTRDIRDQVHVLLQRRGFWTNHGGTWGLFGGARHLGEPANAAALRETAEECTLPTTLVRICGTFRDDHGGWAYETVLGELPSPLPVRPASSETIAAAWVAAERVGSLHLHPGLASTWPALARLVGANDQRDNAALSRDSGNARFWANVIADPCTLRLRTLGRSPTTRMRGRSAPGGT